jgi:hypothetical protein
MIHLSIASFTEDGRQVFRDVCAVALLALLLGAWLVLP